MVIKKFRLCFVINAEKHDTEKCYCEMRYVDIIQT